jgi:hypothetical protein
MAALGLGVALQLFYPWNEAVAEAGGAAWPVWFAVAAAVTTLVIARRVSRRPVVATRWALACAILFALPIGVAGFADLERDSPDRYALTPGLVEAVRGDVKPGQVVFGDLETSYRIAAYAPVYIAAAPPAHVANTRRNRPLARRQDVIRFFYREAVPFAEKARILARSGASWLVVDRTRPVPSYVASLDAPVWEDQHYALYELSHA